MSDTTELTVLHFNDRSGGSKEHPYGFIVFSDETRVVYAPTTNDVDDHGVMADCQQPYGINKAPGARHVKLAHAFIEANNLPLK